MAKSVSFKIYINPEVDADLVAEIEKIPVNERSSVVRTALRLYFADKGRRRGQAAPAASAQVDVPAILAALRPMFEAVLDSKLAGLALTGTNRDGDDGPDLLANLDESFLVD